MQMCVEYILKVDRVDVVVRVNINVNVDIWITYTMSHFCATFCTLRMFHIQLPACA